MEKAPTALRLKREVAVGRAERAAVKPFAHVVVNHGLSDLPDLYTYLVPEKLNDQAAVGSLVQVDFNHRKLTGYIWERSDLPTLADIKDGQQDSPITVGTKIEARYNDYKFIEKVLNTRPLLTLELKSVLPKLMAKYGVNANTLLKTLIPSLGRTKEAEGLSGKNTQELNVGPKSRVPLFHFSQIGSGPFATLGTILERVTKEKDGKAAVFFSTLVELESFSEILRERGMEYRVFHSKLSPVNKTAIYDEIRSGSVQILLSSRNGIFLPFSNNTSLIIYEEYRFGHQEVFTPAWSAGEIALLRSAYFPVHYVSSLPSLQLNDLIMKQDVKVGTGFSLPAINFTFSEKGEREHAQITKTLPQGKVLIVVKDRGEVTAISCGKCFTLARCECGGKLISNAGQLRCQFCQQIKISFKCQQCASEVSRAIAKGSSSIAAEYGKAYPRATVGLWRPEMDHQPDITIASYHDFPTQQYELIIMKNSLDYIYGPNFDSEELATLRMAGLFTNLALGGSVAIEINSEQPFARYLASRKLNRYLDQLANERKALRFPPYYRIGGVKGPISLIDNLYGQIKQAKKFFQANLITEGESAKLVIRAEMDKGEELVKYLQGIRKLARAQKVLDLEVFFDKF